MADEFPWPLHPASNLFPLLSGTELRDLAEDIRAHGLIEPVWLYRDPEKGVLLLDGRNRYKACQIAGVSVRTQTYKGTDPIAFSVSTNLKRRHLTTGQIAFVALAVVPLYEAEAKRRQGTRTDLQRKKNIPADLREGSKPAHEINTKIKKREERSHESAEQAAKVTGAAGRTVAQAKRVQFQAPDLAEKVKAGVMAIDRAERIIRDREAEQRRVDQARAEAAAASRKTKLRVDLRFGDFREVLADVTGVDAVITDPPYGREYLPLLSDLASWSDKVLAPDGVLVVLMGQTHLPDVYRLLDGGRPYRWTACYYTPGPGYRSHDRRLQSNWKPLLVYGAGPRFSDVINSAGAMAGAQDQHKWGQDYFAFHTIIERLTTKGQTVADPFAGSGTTLLAAHALGRHVVGCDIDKKSFEKAKERLK